ncbi:MAG: hypothetical protein JSV35_05080 [Candidatus Bathyarchaeota archaeon]|nr:MAG: hypothetical protein JSV35_05080 [Candidatus Bathyarchaeota archaeon]
MSLRKKLLAFTPVHRTVQEVLADTALARLGDAYTNFIYSLYLSIQKGSPTGKKTGGAILSEALKQVGLKSATPSRMDRHGLADAAESLIVYVWLTGLMTIGESVELMVKHKDSSDAFGARLSRAKERVESCL